MNIETDRNVYLCLIVGQQQMLKVTADIHGKLTFEIPALMVRFVLIYTEVCSYICSLLTASELYTHISTMLYCDWLISCRVLSKLISFNNLFKNCHQNQTISLCHLIIAYKY